MEPSNSEANPGPGGVAGTSLNWSALLAAFRLGPKESWSGPLIDRLEPWLTKARRRLIAVPPVLDNEDIAQHLVVEVLRIAARWRPQCEDRWIPRRLVEAAERRVRMGLSRERSTQAVELQEGLETSNPSETNLVFDTPVGSASAEDLRVLYRVKVLGEPVAALAREAGITPRQMRRRVWSARKRAQASGSTGAKKA